MGLENLYPHNAVATKARGKEFISSVLFPAADIIVNTSFRKSKLRQASREQIISLSDDTGDWATIGFYASRYDPAHHPGAVQFKASVQTACDTGAIPLPAAALAKLLSTSRPVESEAGSSALETIDDEEEEDDVEEIDVGNLVVVEQRDFFINTESYQPVRTVDYVFIYDGEPVWQEESWELRPSHWSGASIAEQKLVEKTEQSMLHTYDELDLQLIGGILERLGLIRQ